jgi:hypothetical protein
MPMVSGGIAPPILTPALVGREYSASRPCRFTPGKKYPVVRYPLDKRLCEHQSRFGHYGEEKDLAPAGNRILAVQPVGRRYTE